MKLSDAIIKLLQAQEGSVIFTNKPFDLSAESEIGVLTDEFKVPDEVANRGLTYFLDLSTAKEVLEVFGEHQPSADEIVSLLMYYATNDAYPEWVYKI